MRKRLWGILAAVVLLLGLAACGEKPVEPEPDMLIKENAVAFADGATASLWRALHFGDYIYRLADGTELLRWTEPTLLSNISVSGLEGYDGLSETAQEKVLTYFEEQGILCDEEGELRRAYEDYCLAKEEGREFRSHILMQDNAPYAENQHYLSCLSVVTVPRQLRYEGVVEEYRYGVIFDKETGDVVPVWDLFTVPEEEARARLVDGAMRYYTGERADVEKALDEQSILWDGDSLELSFPEGSLPAMEYAYRCDIELKDLADILTDKAWQA